MKILRYKFILFFAILLSMTGCKKDFLDTNVDPNNAQDATVDRLLPATIGFTAYALGNQYNVLGGVWSQYWTQGPTASQYEDLDKYLITSTTYNRPWENLYQGPLTDLKLIVDKGLKTGNNNYVGIAKIWQAYVYHILTDVYEDIPFSEAIYGEEGNLTPKYDTQQEVYDGLIRLLDEGLGYLDPDSDITPHDDDLVYGGDIEKWIRFANTLKLKIFLRQSNVRKSVAQAGITAMVAEGAEFIGEGDQAEMKFFNAQFNGHPLHSLITFIGVGNLVASNTSINYLKNTNDARMEIFFDPAANGSYTGINQGEGRLLPNPGSLSANNFSKPSPNIGGYRGPTDASAGKNAPVIFISEAESYFLQAEAALLGYGAFGEPKELYNAGIEASFSYWTGKFISELEYSSNDIEGFLKNVRDTTAAYPDSNATLEDKHEAIITQKWVAMTGNQNLESWIEFRRTGYPSFLIISYNSKIGDKFPARVFYPDSEETRNPKVPAQKTIDARMWWDVN